MSSWPSPKPARNARANAPRPSDSVGRADGCPRGCRESGLHPSARAGAAKRRDGSPVESGPARSRPKDRWRAFERWPCGSSPQEHRARPEGKRPLTVSYHEPMAACQEESRNNFLPPYCHSAQPSLRWRRGTFAVEPPILRDLIAPPMSTFGLRSPPSPTPSESGCRYPEALYR